MVWTRTLVRSWPAAKGVRKGTREEAGMGPSLDASESAIDEEAEEEEE